MHYEHGATRDGRLVYVRARIVLDGGAYASSSTAVCSNAACFAAGPYDVPNARIDSYVMYTNNPPCGAMRGFGAVQVAFAHEAQMDKLAAALDMDPVDLRILNAMGPDSRMPTGQRVGEPARVAELLERVRAMPMPPDEADGLPGGVSNVTHGEGVRRGVGYGIGIKNVGFSEGFDDYSTARVRLSIDDGEPLVEVHTAASEVGQGVVTVQAQIARTELGVERVAVLTADTSVGSAGSSSASRQTYVTGGAVKAACEAVRERLLETAAERLGEDPARLALVDGRLVGAGHGAEYDILGLRMFDSAELRVHPTGKAMLRMGTKSQGQGHETTFAQIVTEELGIPAADVAVEEGDTDTAPYGLGTYASRSTAVAGAATAMVARKLRDKARKIASHLLEAAEEDLEWENGRFYVKGSTDRAKTIQEIAFAAYSNIPEGMEAGLEGVHYYDPPNMTFPFGTYAVVVDIDKCTGQVKVRRVVAVDDCGVRINPMIVEGQIHGGLAEGYGIAFMELITFDAEGNCIGSNFMDYLLPTAWETPRFELGETNTPSPHHPLGAKGVGESPTVGSPAAYVNAVIDALSPYGVTNIDMPVTSDKVWAALRAGGVTE